MKLENYLIYLEKTAIAYSDKVKKHLISLFLKERVAIKGENSGQLSLDNYSDCVDISDRNANEQLFLCIRHSEKARLLYEKWEFEKDYKYSVLFTCEYFTRETLNK